MTKCQYQQCKRVLNTRVERIKQTKWKSNKINTHISRVPIKNKKAIRERYM